MNSEKDVTFHRLMSLEEPQEFIESAYPFMKLMKQYQCAMLEVQTKFEVLKRKNLELTLSNIEKNLHDVAGIRVICSFPKDIYRLAEKICSRDDIRLIDKKDYIRSPKKNGCRSLHLILEVPVFFADETKQMQEIGECIELHRGEESDK